MIDIEPKVFNTAYMQLARYHRDRGDTVEWWSPLADRRFDKVFCSSIFDFTDKSEVPKRAICGGTGFDVSSRLPAEIENCDLDYSIYPKCRTSYLWFSRGCVRNCLWCIVYEKEGYIHTVRLKNLNPNGEYITVQDNNFFANPAWPHAIKFLLKDPNEPVDMQGIDIRTMNYRRARALASLRHYKQIKFAWDIPADEKQVLRGIKTLVRYVPARKCMCYVLIGFWDNSEASDLHRVETLRRLGIDPFVMPFDRSELYQRAFARWVNHKAIFKKVPWKDYWANVTKQESSGNGWSGFDNRK